LQKVLLKKEADVLKKASQRHLIALKLGQPAFLQNAPSVKFAFMCNIIKICCFAGVFQHVRLLFYATNGYNNPLKS
jgi:hypothetical protein